MGPFTDFPSPFENHPLLLVNGIVLVFLRPLETEIPLLVVVFLQTLITPESKN